MTSAVSEDRREFPRISGVFHVTYYLDGDIVPTTSENISPGGMRIITPRLIPSGKVLDFIITFKGKPVEVRGRIVYVASDRMHAGIQFENVLHSQWKGSPQSLDQFPFDPGYLSEEILV